MNGKEVQISSLQKAQILSLPHEKLKKERNANVA